MKTAIRLHMPLRYLNALTLCAISVFLGCNGNGTSPDAVPAHRDSATDGAAAKSDASTDVSEDREPPEMDGGMRVCGLDTSCSRCTTGVCCGSGCCKGGEWCDQSGAIPSCRCANGPACLAPNICTSLAGLAGTCGNECCNPGNGAGIPCPMSRRSAKTDIVPVGPTLSARLHRDLLGVSLATYRYRGEAPNTSRHLGFIIDDLKTAIPVNPDGNSVDLYAYTSMAVAAIKEQEGEIAKLRAEVLDRKSTRLNSSH